MLRRKNLLAITTFSAALLAPEIPRETSEGAEVKKQPCFKVFLSVKEKKAFSTQPRIPR